MTAVIVAHDGAVWLPRLLDALAAQTKPVRRVVAADTGSRDASGELLASRLGQAAVVGTGRTAGYAAAVHQAVSHPAAAPDAAGPGEPGQMEWLWLLHDDCEPEPDALEQLLRGATEVLRTAVAGPKQRDWADRGKIIEAGVTIDTAGRRVTGVEPRESDHGQHDGDRDALAVSSAGMLVRRDVWERLGGFDPALPLFGEDTDFCWRVHQAGFRVRVVTGAVIYHARAAAAGRRAVSVGRPARLQRRAGLLALLANLPAGPMLLALAGNLCLSVLRTLFLLAAKSPAAALDESAAVTSVLGDPMRVARLRRHRSRGRRSAYGMLRAYLPPGRSVRRAAEMAATALARPAQGSLAGSRHASDDPADDDSMLTDTGFVRRLLGRPGVLLVLGLIVVAAVAERRVLAGGLLGGGALLPAREGASGLWSQFLAAYHTIGTGSAAAAPPYVALLAVLATVLFGKAWLAVDVLLLGCVPLAGLTAYAAAGLVTRTAWLRVWAAAAYALLPVAFGAIAAGRLGSAVAFALIPAIAGLAGRVMTQQGSSARRAAWAAALAVTVAAAFVPLVWPLTVAAAVLGALASRRAALLPNLAIVAVTPLVLLAPWLAGQLAHPSALLLEAGIRQPGLAASGLPARSLVLLSPGGPGLPPFWASAALLVAGLAALLASRRLTLVAAGWAVTLLGLAAALLASRVTVTPAGGQPVTPWPGAALAVAAAGLLLAAAAAADGALQAGWLAGRRSRARAVPAAVLALVGLAAPVIAAGWWLASGVAGPLQPAPAEVVPPLVASAAGTGQQVRTLVLTTSGGQVSYLLLRGISPEFSYPGITQVPAAQAALSRAVAALAAPGGSGTADQSRMLASFDIGFVLVRAPVNPGLAGVLDGVPGLTQVSVTRGFDLWQLASLPSRVSVAEPDGTVAAVKSGRVSVTGAAVPAAGGTLLLAEPSGGWTAKVNGRKLAAVPSPAGSWAQAFRLPPGGGTLTLSRDGQRHNVAVGLQLLLFLVVAGLALPGMRPRAAGPGPAAAGPGGTAEQARDEKPPAAPEPAVPAGAPALAGGSLPGRRVVAGSGPAAASLLTAPPPERDRGAPRPRDWAAGLGPAGDAGRGLEPADAAATGMISAAGAEGRRPAGRPAPRAARSEPFAPPPPGEPRLPDPPGPAERDGDRPAAERGPAGPDGAGGTAPRPSGARHRRPSVQSRRRPEPGTGNGGDTR